MNEVLPPEDENAVALNRHSHDFARRLPYRGGDAPLFRDEDLAHLKGDATAETLQSLVETLTVPVPDDGSSSSTNECCFRTTAS